MRRSVSRSRSATRACRTWPIRCLICSLSSATDQPVTVNYATLDGTATAGIDYTAATGTITFAPGQTTQAISIPLIGDTTFENNESFSLQLSNPSNATLDREATRLYARWGETSLPRQLDGLFL